MYRSQKESGDHLTDQVVYIANAELDDSAIAEECRLQAEANGKQFERIEGNMALIRKLIDGEWNEQDFLVVKEGESITGVYDWDTVIETN